ncbi:MAG: PH domain-containing protein [Microbacterium sp.]|uniref:PH domain-containing protein n=1 Tax=Microbacterium sp. TaxID=51671 RepID=UPI001AC304E1|nr:PH domain-containing protein [Microbacterium sp.]MBN9175971.1 PH domain-containing protein [Microbacterium sp.]
MRFAQPRPGAPARRVLRPTSGTVILIVSGVVALWLLVDAAVRAGGLEMLRLAPWILLAVWGVYVALYSPHVAYDRDGVLVQNYLRRTWIPWSRVADIDMRWQLQFALTGGTTVVAYGGPVAGRPGRAARAARDAGRVPAWMRDVGDLRDAWQASDSAASGTGALTRSWDVPGLLAFGVLVVAAAASALSVA